MNRAAPVQISRAQNPMGALPGNDADCLFLPRLHNRLAWSCQPAEAASNSAVSSGILLLSKIYIPRSITVNNVTIIIQTAGSSLTTGENFLGLYSSGGALLAQTADQTTNWGSNGAKTAALTASATLNSGNAEDFWVWAARLGNGTTLPSVCNVLTSHAAVINDGLSAANSRCGYLAGPYTALPASFTPASITQYNHMDYVALS